MATRQIPWARIFAEGVAIVVSILLAFAIQAWWDEAQDSERLDVALTNLEAGLTESLPLLSRQIERLQGREQLLASFLGREADDLIDPPPDSARQLLGEVFRPCVSGAASLFGC